MQDKKCDSLSIYGTVTFPPSVITDALEIITKWHFSLLTNIRHLFFYIAYSKYEVKDKVAPMLN
jgi:hypothetical protein